MSTCPKTSFLFISQVCDFGHRCGQKQQTDVETGTDTEARHLITDAEGRGDLKTIHILRRKVNLATPEDTGEDKKAGDHLEICRGNGGPKYACGH